MLNIICFMGGTAGDLITAVIDSAGVEVNNGSITLPISRALFKKPHNFNNDFEKDTIIETTSYQSISSHDYEYHQQRGHNLLCIGIDDMPSAMWAAVRFKNLHRPQVWTEMTQKCGANSIEEYAQMYIDFTNMVRQNPKVRILNITDILTGKLLEVLTEMGITTDRRAEEIYTAWTKTNKL